MNKNATGISIALIIIAVFFSGCSHQLEIKNVRSFQSTSWNTLENDYTVGVVSRSSDIHSERLIKNIAKEIGRCGADVCLPYVGKASRNVDIIAAISIKPEYKGSGWNFWINFPGFLIFAPAWNGYVYKANYDINVQLSRESDGEKIDQFDVPVYLNIRHADTNRTWTEISWLEVGAIAFIGGLVFIQYDDNITPLVVDKAKAPVGDYIAQEIVSRVNNMSESEHASKNINPATSDMILK